MILGKKMTDIAIRIIRPAGQRRRRPELRRLLLITFGEMRAMRVRGMLIYCADYRCGHSVAMSADRWPDDVRLSDI